MDEKSKSIWKKSWKGPRGLFLWFILLTTAVFIIFFAIGFTIEPGSISNRATVVGINGFVISIAFGLIGTFIVWFIRWLCNWRNLKKFLFGLACFTTLIALIYAEEDWRGKRAWNNYVHECEAAGESMDWNAYIPPQIPDDQNLAMCPLLKPILDYTQTNISSNDRHTIWNDTNGIMRVQRLSARWNDIWHYGPSSEQHRLANTELDEYPLRNGWINLLAWQNYFRTGTNLDGITTNKSPAQDVLLALRFMEPDLAELQVEAARCPLTRWPVHYETDFKSGILLPHLGDIRQLVKTLQLRSAARLAEGDVTGGMADFQLGFRLANSVENEFFLITLLVRENALEDILQPLREGIARRQFSETQLSLIQQQLATLDFFKSYHRSFLTERTMHSDWDKISPDTVNDLFRGMNMRNQVLMKIKLLLRFAPKGWVYQNQLSLCRLEDRWMQEINTNSHQAVPGLAKNVNQLADKKSGLFSIFTELLFSFNVQTEAALGTAWHQTTVGQAIVACALERYRIAHGNFPDSLDALAPQFIEKIPHDVIGGQPLHYRKTANGQFVLYSVGWNETDDGGVVVFKKNSNPREEVKSDVDLNQGDWVWRYPQK